MTWFIQYQDFNISSSLSLSLRVKQRLATLCCEIGAIIIKDDLEGGNCLDDFVFKNIIFLKGGNQISFLMDMRIWCINHRLVIHRWEWLGWCQKHQCHIWFSLCLHYITFWTHCHIVEVFTPHSLTRILTNIQNWEGVKQIDKLKKCQGFTAWHSRRTSTKKIIYILKH